MRVTNSMLVGNLMNNLNNNMSRLDKLQTQMATNRKFAHISDDPVSVIYSQQANYKLFRLENYKKNVETSQNWLNQTEAGIMELNEVFKSALEACIDASTDVKGEGDKGNAAQYIAQLRDHVITALNASLGSKYVFGGYNTTGFYDGTQVQTPFTVENGKLHYNGFDLTADMTDPANAAIIADMENDVLTFDIGAGIEMPVTFNGVTIAMFDGENNLYNLLDDLYNTMVNGGGATDISDYIPKLQEAQNYLLRCVAEVGGRTNRLEILSSRYEQDYLNYMQMKSDAEDADEAEIIMKYKIAESVYKAALSSGSSIIQPTLMDFMR